MKRTLTLTLIAALMIVSAFAITACGEDENGGGNGGGTDTTVSLHADTSISEPPLAIVSEPPATSEAEISNPVANRILIHECEHVAIFYLGINMRSRMMLPGILTPDLVVEIENRSDYEITVIFGNIFEFDGVQLETIFPWFPVVAPNENRISDRGVLPVDMPMNPSEEYVQKMSIPKNAGVLSGSIQIDHRTTYETRWIILHPEFNFEVEVDHN